MKEDYIYKIYLEYLKRHDSIADEFKNKQSPSEWLGFIVQFHSVIESFCKTMFRYFSHHTEIAIKKDLNRYTKIALIHCSSKNDYNLNYLLEIPDTAWIAKIICDTSEFKSFMLRKGRFIFWFSLLTPNSYDILEGKVSYTIDFFASHTYNLIEWRNDIVHNYLNDKGKFNVPNGMYDTLNDLQKREEFADMNKKLLKFIYFSIREECTPI